MNMSSSITVRVSVLRLLSVLADGAVIFSASAEKGGAIRIVASSHVFPRVPVPGEAWVIEGAIRDSEKYGTQLHASSARCELPRGRLLVRYLSEHPDFRGIGVVKAKRLWDAFGERLAQVLSDRETDQVERVVGAPLARRIVDVWGDKKAESAMIEFLDAHGLDWRLATTLNNVWGSRALDLLRNNPYHLLAFASWSRVDAIGTKLGLATDDERRLIGAVESLLYERLQQGHTITSSLEFEKALAGRMKKGLARRALHLAMEEDAVRGGPKDGYQAIGAWALEHLVACRISAMLGRDRSGLSSHSHKDASMRDLRNEIATTEYEWGFDFDDDQRAAVEMAFANSFCLLSGGAGVGKTTALRAVVRLAQLRGLFVVQMALAGRAAQQMEKATGHSAMTIARFLHAVRSQRIELPDACLLIVDEASMLDLSTFYRMLQHMPDGARLMLVGDGAQLPPIGFGLVFHRLEGHPSIPQRRLTIVYRQASASGIPSIAAEIRKHRVPVLCSFSGRASGVSFVQCDPEEVIDVLRSIVSEWASDDWQILAAVKSGRDGVRHINSTFHALKSPESGQHGFRLGEPIIHLVNDYERGLMNGALGRVASLDERDLEVDFSGDLHKFKFEEVPGRLDLAYCISVHKAQGSQFSRVAVVIANHRLVDHSLVYTALTRGVDQVVFVGSFETFRQAVLSPSTAQRRDVAFGGEEDFVG